MVYEIIEINVQFLEWNCLFYDNGVINFYLLSNLCIYTSFEKTTQLRVSANFSIKISYSDLLTYSNRTVYDISETNRVNLDVKINSHSFSCCIGLFIVNF